MTNETVEEYLTFAEYRAGILIWKVVPPILILFGTIGNILSIVVLARRLIKTSTTALYLTFLAFSDLLVLYTGLLRQWLYYLIEYDVRHVSEAACKIHIWLVYSSLDFSAWILIGVTLERVISTWCPHSAKSKCNRKNATILLITILFFCFGLNSHLLFGMVYKYSPEGHITEKCASVDEAYGVFFNLTWPWIDLCAFCLIPFSVIVVGNGFILFKVIKSRRKTQARIQPSVRSQHGSSHHNHSSMTAMLFTLNMVFLFTTSPVSIYNIGYPIWLEDASEQEKASLEFWWAVVNMLMYTNNSLNFLLYCLSGSRFRMEVQRLFCPRPHQRSNTALNDITRTKIPTKSRTPTASQNRDASFNRNPSNTLIPSTHELEHSNGAAFVISDHLCPPINGNTNTPLVTENDPFTNSESAIKETADKIPSTDSRQMFVQPNVTLRELKDTTKEEKTTIPTNGEAQCRYEKLEIPPLESYHNVTTRTINVMPKISKDDESLTDSERAVKNDICTISSLCQDNDTQRTADLRSETQKYSESIENSEGFTKQETHFTYLTAQPRESNWNVSETLKPQQNENDNDKSPDDETRNMKAAVRIDTSNKFLSNNSGSNHNDKAKEGINSEEQTNVREVDNQKLSNCSQENGMFQSTTSAKLAVGINLETVSSV